jgi:hypothetical protein
MPKTPVMHVMMAVAAFGVPALAWADKAEKHVRRVTHGAAAPADWSAAPGTLTRAKVEFGTAKWGARRRRVLTRDGQHAPQIRFCFPRVELWCD